MRKERGAETSLWFGFLFIMVRNPRNERGGNNLFLHANPLKSVKPRATYKQRGVPRFFCFH